jgi:hypothetical protein
MESIDFELPMTPIKQEPNKKRNLLQTLSSGLVNAFNSMSFFSSQNKDIHDFIVNPLEENLDRPEFTPPRSPHPLLQE